MTRALCGASMVTQRGAKKAGMIMRAKAPLRISFSGGGTDLPHWYEEHGGAVFSSTINRYAYATLYPREDRLVRIQSVGLGYFVNYHNDEGPMRDGVLDPAQNADQRLRAGRGMEIDVRSPAPPASRLG